MSIMRTKVVFSTFYILLVYLIFKSAANSTNKEPVEFIHGGDHSSSGHGGSEGCINEYSIPPVAFDFAAPHQQEPAPLWPTAGPEQLVFADQRLAVVYPVIQNFKAIITSDPLGITKSWVGSDICSYKGFYCDNPPDNKTAIAFASIDFNGFQLGAPTLDGFLDQLPDIALFHANSNDFAGSLSPGITKLPYLYEIDISNNKFSGSFPMAVLGMESLTFLDIRFNLFTGTVPQQLFTRNLVVLFINDNNFMRLPDNIGSSHLLYLTLANNKFMGAIPRSISKALSALTEVLFLNNMLNGCLPYEIGFLKETTVFDVGNNRLTGPLPFSLGCMEKVELLNFAGNLFYGMVPEVVCMLGNLVNLSLSDNYFTQVGPVCRDLIMRGVLDVRKNCIHDLPAQRSVVECAHFFAHPRLCPYFWPYAYNPCELPYFSSHPIP